MKKSKVLNRNHILFLFTLPILIMYCVFFIIPLLMGMKNSFTDWSGTSPDYNFIGIKNYIDIFQDERFRNALIFNFKYTILLTVYRYCSESEDQGTRIFPFRIFPSGDPQPCDRRFDLE